MKEFHYPISVLQNQLSYLHIGITHSVFGIVRGKTSFLFICLCGPPCQLLAANSWRFLFAHICRNSLFIICSLQNSSYCLLSTISGIFTINALLQQPCVPFHFDKQASFATSTPTNFCLQNHKCFLRQVKDFMV